MSRVEQFLLGSGHNRACIQVGLVNNMPDAAMRATELQFARLLKEAAGALDVRLRLFSMRSIPRSEQTRSRMAGFYDDAAFLQAANLDALIITGAQPEAADLRDEPYWQELAQIIDWAETGTISAMFSCLAAHAVLLQLEGIGRRTLPAKLCGIYESMRVDDDPLFFSTNVNVPVPHSRKNDIAESDLIAKGYRVLSRLGNGQVDIFTREPPGQSRFVLFQGHPEYDPGTLGREYLRDMGHFLRSENDERPGMPENYFDPATESQLQELVDGKEADLARYSEIVTNALPLKAWRANSVRFFGNWLTLIAAAKARKAAVRSVHTRRRAS
ncbi:MAG TPA: homoserine O-succinyltransferase [Rhizomicrobium sp.]|nr:homoserine O-succinyltransferase [Rhizomicrobium sp.]